MKAAIIEMNGGQFGYNNNIEKEPFEEQTTSAVIPFTLLHRGDKQIDNKKLKEFIINIFKTLENYSFSVSNLKTIVSSNTDLVEYEIIDQEGNKDEDADEDDYLPKEIDNTNILGGKKDATLDASVPEIWFNTLSKKYKNEKFRVMSTIFYFRFMNYTYQEIGDLFDPPIPHSTVESRFKKIIKLFKINQYFHSEDDGFRRYIDVFLSKIEPFLDIKENMGETEYE